MGGGAWPFLVGGVICLARKEGFFGPKIGEKLKCKGKKLSNFPPPKKETFWAKKKQAGAELEKKKRSF